MGFVKPVPDNTPPKHVCLLPAAGGWFVASNRFAEGTLYDCEKCGTRYRMIYPPARRGRPVGLGTWVKVSKKNFPAEGD